MKRGGIAPRAGNRLQDRRDLVETTWPARDRTTKADGEKGHIREAGPRFDTVEERL